MYLGIDLGTSNSAVVGNIDSQLRVFKTSDGSDVLPSVIYIDQRGHRLYGRRAYEQTRLSPDNVAKGFKRLMGTSTPIKFRASGEVMTAEECSAEILRQLVSQALLETNASEITGTAVTIPAAFNQMQSESTLRAAAAAGLDRVVLLQEPIAAAMAQANNNSGQFLVYDLGGGTFDLALIQNLSGSINIIGHEGINMLGGQDFDRILIAEVIRPWLMKTFSLPEDFQKQDKYGRLIGKSLMAAEAAKIDLSTANASTIFMSDEDIRIQDQNGTDIYLDITVTRHQFEELVEPLLVQTLEMSRSIIKANGYTAQDIDRIVFVGGPSKMPWIRERVPRELGVAADLSVDPMTAVAMGAAIYAESREWAASNTKRKATRTTTEVAPHLGLKFDYQARTTQDSVRLRVRAEADAVAARLSVQIDAPEHGWTSGRTTITHDTTIDLPTRTLGENQFQVAVFDGSGLPIAQAASTIVITRTHSTAAAIPATQTIAVKVRTGSTGIRNALQPLIKKGTPLPASGSQPLRAAYAIGPNLPGQIDLELFQDEGAPEPDLNLAIGSFRIRHHDLPEGMMIREGDPVTFHWSMDDSGLLTATVELPSVQQTFSSSRFYVDQEGHRSFEGEAGEKLVETTISEAEKEAAEVVSAVGASAKQLLDAIDRKLEEQRRKLGEASSGDERRSITETVRHTRQEIARLKFHPDHRGRFLEHKLNDLITRYNNYARPEKPTPQSERFDQQSLAAMNELRRRTPTAFDLPEIIIEQMEMIYWRTLWEKPDFVLAMFRQASGERHLSKNNETFDLLVGDGENAVKANDVDELRGIVLRLWHNQINTTNAIGDVGRLASVLRG
jgi:molecular chaperone DnaK